VSLDRDTLRRAWRFALDSYHEFSLDGGSRLSAALAYYLLFVMAPATLVLVSVAAHFGEGLLQSPLIEGLTELLGADLAMLLADVLRTTTQARASLAAGIVGIVATLWALGIFYFQVQSVFNRMWRVTRRPGSAWRITIWTRLRRFTVMLVPVALLAVGAVATGVASLLGSILHLTPTERAIQIAASPYAVAGAAAISFCLLYKYLPDAQVRWRYAIWVSVWVAAGWTLGTYLFGLYLSWGRMASAYGAAGAVFVLLIWLNYSARLVLVGCKATKRWTELAEGVVTPLPNATNLKVELESPQ